MQKRVRQEQELANFREPTLRSGVQRRLAFIDFRLFWDGRFNRRNLVDAFGISTQQASADIAQYASFAPANMSYDAGRKAFLRTPQFRPAFTVGSAERYLLHLIAIDNQWVRQQDTWFETRPPVENASLVRKATDPMILLDILDAIHRECLIEIRLGDNADCCNIAPHALFHCGGRWFVRAWSQQHGDFRDQNMSQIVGTGEMSSSPVHSSLDCEWHRTIDLEIAANPDLTQSEQAALAREYGMIDGRLVTTRRLSQVPLVLAENHLDLARPRTPSERQTLVLLNRDAVAEACAAARDHSVEALAKFHDAQQD